MSILTAPVLDAPAALPPVAAISSQDIWNLIWVMLFVMGITVLCGFVSAALVYALILRLDDLAYQTGTSSLVPIRIPTVRSEDVPAYLLRTRRMCMKIYVVLLGVGFGELSISFAGAWLVLRDALGVGDMATIAVVLVGIMVDLALFIGVIVLAVYHLIRAILARRQERALHSNTTR